jgi:hypothetical protein
METRGGHTSVACFSFFSFFRGGSATRAAGGGDGGGEETSGVRAPCWTVEGKKDDSDANMKDKNDDRRVGLCRLLYLNKEGVYRACSSGCGRLMSSPPANYLTSIG